MQLHQHKTIFVLLELVLIWHYLNNDGYAFRFSVCFPQCQYKDSKCWAGSSISSRIIRYINLEITFSIVFVPYWCWHSVIFNWYQNCQKYGIWKISSFYCCVQLVSQLRYLYRFYHLHATRLWSDCNEMYHNVFRYEHLTFQTQIHLHKQYIFDTNVIQIEYAFLFPVSI